MSKQPKIAGPLAKVVGTVMKSTPTWKDKLFPEDYENLKATFDLFDDDHSGYIDPEEINKIMLQLGQQRKTNLTYSLIEGLKNKNKPINFEEFLDSVCPKIGDLKTKEGIKTIFKHLDKQDDDVLDFQQLKSLARLNGDQNTDEDILQMLHSIHINWKTQTNESLGQEEFYQIVSKFYKK